MSETQSRSATAEPAATEKQPSFLGPRMITVAFVSLTGAFGLNLAAGQFFAPLADRFGWGLQSLSAVVALNMLVWGLLQPVMGRMIDRFGPRIVMTSSATLMGLSYLLCAVMDQLWQFVVLFGVLTAVGFAGCSSMAASVLVSRWYAVGRPKALARSSMGINAGQLILLPLTGTVIAAAGPTAAFLTLGGVMLLFVVPALALLARNSPAEAGQTVDGTAPTTATKPPAASLSDALRDGNFWLTSLSFAACGYSLYLFTTHLPKYAVELGGNVGTGGRLMAVSAAASALVMWLSGSLAPRWGKRRLLIGLHLVRAAAFAGLALATTIPQLYAFTILFGLSSFPVIPLTTGIIADRFGATAMGGILGSTWLIHQLCAAAGVFGGGLLRSVTGSYSAAFASGTVVLLLGAVLIAPVRERSVAALQRA
ncbi:MFS transporter [Streptomyces sp. 8N616]|uniref:MFS transporter n=1 Tax=Streptomyces sp. 8N616 TaxID=3457414 RepID=UPI003FD1C7F4